MRATTVDDGRVICGVRGKVADVEVVLVPVVKGGARVDDAILLMVSEL